MKFKKIFLIILLLGIIIPGMLAAEKWQDKDAQYRVSFTLPRKGAPGFWKVGNYAFPFDLQDGFTAWDEAGKKYKFYFDLRSKLLTLAAAGKDKQKVYIYPSKKALEKILKKRHYYVPKRYLRDWAWWTNQPPSQAVNVVLLSYGADPKAKAKAAAKAKAEAKAKARAKAQADATAKAEAKAVARDKLVEKARIKAEAKAIAKARSAAIAQVKAIAESKGIAKVRAETQVGTKLKVEVKPQIDTRAKADAEAKAVAKIRAKVRARARARLKARDKAAKENKVVKRPTKRRSKKKRKPRPKRLARIGHLPAKDFPADAADLKEIFKYKIKQYVYRRNHRDTNFIRPIYGRLKGNYVAYIDAKVNIAKFGEYQFAVKSNDMVQFYVNGEKALNIDKKTASTSKWRETKEFYIYETPVKIEAYYRSSIEKTSLVIGWRAKGEKVYKFISQKDYVNFNKVEPESLTTAKGQNLPVIKYDMMGYFQNQQGKQFLLGFETNFSSNKIDWQIDGKTIDNGKKIMMTFANKIPENISCVVDDSKAFKVMVPKVDLNDAGALMKRDLYVKINAPIFIYDDENLDLSAEFHSELQIEIKAFLESKSNSDIFEIFRFSQAFKKTSNDPLFRTRDFIKKHFKLEGAKLKSGTELEFSIKTSADNVKLEEEKFYFDHKKVIFKKLSKCSDLKTKNGHFIDANDNRVIPILHRPTLDDKRSWSLFDSLPMLLGGQSTLLIADDFGDEITFSAELFKNAESAKRELVFEDWNLKAFDADIVAETAAKITLIRNSKATVLIILPSTYPIMRGTSPRLQQRLLAALIETARDNKNIKKIILTTPFPLAKPFAGNETMDTMFSNIQHLVSEQEINFMSLPELSEDEETILGNTHPATKSKEYADILIK